MTHPAAEAINDHMNQPVMWPSPGGPGDGYYLQIPEHIMNTLGGFENFRDKFLQSTREHLLAAPIGNLRGFQVVDKKGNIAAKYTLPDDWAQNIEESNLEPLP